MQINLDYIITGTGRCGTLFAANFLTSAGAPCSHEAIFTPLGIDFAMEVLSGARLAKNSEISKGSILSDDKKRIAAESSFMSAPFLNMFERTKVIHMVRNPLKVVRSFMGMGYFTNPFVFFEESPYEFFIYENMPELREEMSQLERTCLYWILWNELIENTGRVSYRHNLEASTDGLSNFTRLKGKYSKMCNLSRHICPKWSLAQIKDPSIRSRLKNLARKYGYFDVVHL